MRIVTRRNPVHLRPVLSGVAAWGLVLSSVGCDGLFGDDDDDSTAADYQITLLATYSEEPLVGVPIWLGTDGTGPVLTTDASGSVTLTLSSPVASFSFGYAYTRSDTNQNFRRIRTYLNYPLESTNTFYVYDYNLSVNTGDEISGTVKGIDTSSSHSSNNIYLGLGNETSEGVWAPKLGQAKSSSLSFSVEFPSPCFLYATQVDQNDPAGYQAIPHLFGLVLNPSASETVNLDRRFDKTVNLAFQSIDPQLTTSYNDLSIKLPNDCGTLFFTDKQYALTSNDSRRIPVPELTGSLEGATLDVSAAASNEEGTQLQAVIFENVAPGSTQTVSMPSLHALGSYVPLDGNGLAGLNIDITGDSGSDYQMVYYRDSATAGDEYFYNYWYVYQYDSSEPIVFAPPPTGTFAFPSDGDGATLTYSYRYAESWVYKGYLDSTPGHSITIVALSTTSPE